jgi:hypothetical protein
VISAGELGGSSAVLNIATSGSLLVRRTS